MGMIPSQRPHDLAPSSLGRASEPPTPAEAPALEAWDSLDAALQEEMSRASLYPRSGQGISDEEILSRAVEKGWVRVGLKAYFRMMELWGIGDEEAASLLGFDHRPVEAEIGIEPLKRISHTIAIFRALHTLLSEGPANAWIRKPNTAEPFGGKPALDLLRTGTEGFEAVRCYLAAAL